MQLIPIPALNDNYIWLLHDDIGNAIVVDPGAAEPVTDILYTYGLTLHAILLTHHHQDHIGGVTGLLQKYSSAVVYAPADPRINHTYKQAADGEQITIAKPACTFDVLAVPGHTLSHLAYANADFLFCGDTLFSLGCGRLFEGTAAQMLASLDRLSELSTHLLVCSAHEYTAANGRFALTIEPNNIALHERLLEVAQQQAKGQPTLPVTLASELASNPFLRVDQPDIIAWCDRHGVAGNRITRFAALRQAKDNFHDDSISPITFTSLHHIKHLRH